MNLADYGPPIPQGMVHLAPFTITGWSLDPDLNSLDRAVVTFCGNVPKHERVVLILQCYADTGEPRLCTYIPNSGNPGGTLPLAFLPGNVADLARSLVLDHFQARDTTTPWNHRSATGR